MVVLARWASISGGICLVFSFIFVFWLTRLGFIPWLSPIWVLLFLVVFLTASVLTRWLTTHVANDILIQLTVKKLCWFVSRTNMSTGKCCGGQDPWGSPGAQGEIDLGIKNGRLWFVVVRCRAQSCLGFLRYVRAVSELERSLFPFLLLRCCSVFFARQKKWWPFIRNRFDRKSEKIRSSVFSI